MEIGPLGLWGATGTLKHSQRLAILRISLIPPQRVMSGIRMSAARRSRMGRHMKRLCSLSPTQTGSEICRLISAMASGNSGPAGSSYHMQLISGLFDPMSHLDRRGSVQHGVSLNGDGKRRPTASCTATKRSMANCFSASVNARGWPRGRSRRSNWCGQRDQACTPQIPSPS